MLVKVGSLRNSKQLLPRSSSTLWALLACVTPVGTSLWRTSNFNAPFDAFNSMAMTHGLGPTCWVYVAQPRETQTGQLVTVPTEDECQTRCVSLEEPLVEHHAVEVEVPFPGQVTVPATVDRDLPRRVEVEHLPLLRLLHHADYTIL